MFLKILISISGVFITYVLERLPKNKFKTYFSIIIIISYIFVSANYFYNDEQQNKKSEYMIYKFGTLVDWSETTITLYSSDNLTDISKANVEIFIIPNQLLNNKLLGSLEPSTNRNEISYLSYETLREIYDSFFDEKRGGPQNLYSMLRCKKHIGGPCDVKGQTYPLLSGV